MVCGVRSVRQFLASTQTRLLKLDKFHIKREILVGSLLAVILLPCHIPWKVVSVSFMGAVLQLTLALLFELKARGTLLANCRLNAHSG